MESLLDLPNVGKVLYELLQRAQIDTPETLRRIGSKEAFLRIRLLDSTACLHMLYGIQGAIDGIRDTLLSEGTKNDLKTFYKTL